MKYMLLAETSRLPVAQQGLDGGPRYIETDWDAVIREPWNGATSLVFLLIVGYWFWRLRGQYRRYLFVTLCMVPLTISSLGSAIYHAFRSHRFFLVMDWLPIAVLAVAAGIYLWVKLLPGRWRWLAAGIAPAVVGIQRVNFGLAESGAYPLHWAINGSYALMATVIIVPLIGVLRQRNWAHFHLPALAVLVFAAALAFRAFDAELAWLLPMGSHFLWHLFAAGATALAVTYFYRLRRDELQPQSGGEG
jgi:predicted membrane channel-forming protein YqfA (hemolysin III family)